VLPAGAWVQASLPCVPAGVTAACLHGGTVLPAGSRMQAAWKQG
jgi:hypothetical protein